MSEDEIIDKINYMIDNWHRNVVEIDIQWIQGLLDLYNKEKEKNEELDEKLKMSIAMLTKGTYPETEKGANDFDNYFISKDKIRDMQRYREFELQQEYKEFEDDIEWQTYNKILEEE